MLTSAPFFPPRASALAREIDALFFTTLGFAIVFSTLIAVLLVVFAVKFRRRSPSEVGREMTGSSAAVKCRQQRAIRPAVIDVILDFRPMRKAIIAAAGYLAVAAND